MTPSYFKACAEQDFKKAVSHLVEQPDDAVVSSLIVIMPDGRNHTKVVCGKGRTLDEVLDGLKKCQREIEWQIANKQKCPFSAP